MTPNSEIKAQIINTNRSEYGYYYDLLRFPTQEQVQAFTSSRAKLLTDLADYVRYCCNGSKLDCRNLSPGCLSCIAGSWSCLFINGRCNCNCFYCPSPQDQNIIPVTNGLFFANAEEYADYLNAFGFTGASISGGEPLLTADRTLEYIAKVRSRCGDDLHIWLYTNGTLLTPDLCNKLRDAGLDEIRFDTGAIRHNLKKVRLAIGKIPTISVEIPAVPEEYQLLKGKLREMADIGVSHLNLHQLRLTPHNLKKFARRNYTYIHGDKITVLESELTALKLIYHAYKYNINLPVNYCSYVYKRRFQHAAVRRRAAEISRYGYEAVTPSGYLRTISITSTAKNIKNIVMKFVDSGLEPDLWSISEDKLTLNIFPRLWPLVNMNIQISLNYHEAALVRFMPGNKYKEVIFLSSGRRIAVARKKVYGPISVTASQVKSIVEGGLNLTINEIAPYEVIPDGLAEYF